MITKICLISFIDDTSNWPREFSTIKQFKIIEDESDFDFQQRVEKWILEDRNLNSWDIRNLKITCEGIWRRNDRG
jgi:hypothetical protein